jgi:hypothetical protein
MPFLPPCKSHGSKKEVKGNAVVQMHHCRLSPNVENEARRNKRKLGKKVYAPDFRYLVSNKRHCYNNRGRVVCALLK